MSHTNTNQAGKGSADNRSPDFAKRRQNHEAINWTKKKKVTASDHS